MHLALQSLPSASPKHGFCKRVELPERVRVKFGTQGLLMGQKLPSLSLLLPPGLNLLSTFPQPMKLLWQSVTNINKWTSARAGLTWPCTSQLMGVHECKGTCATPRQEPRGCCSLRARLASSGVSHHGCQRPRGPSSVSGFLWKLGSEARCSHS